MKTAGFVVIGDEILSGKVKDENSFVFTQTMFERGVVVEKIEIIPDNIEQISARVAYLSSKYSYVATSGGVGPTHDDKTLEGIAQAFGIPLRENSQAREYFCQAQQKAGRGSKINQAQKKMITLPDPSELYFVESLWLPLIVVQNVYIFPGVPKLFKKLIASYKNLFSGRPLFRGVVYSDKTESAIALKLEAIQKKFPNIKIGSYPQSPNKSYRIMITLEGQDQTGVEELTNFVAQEIGGRRTQS